MVTFRSFSFAFAGLAMAVVLIPPTMAFLPSRMTIRTTVETMDSYFFWSPVDLVEEFFESVDLLIDYDTFLAASIDNYDFIPAKTPSAKVYSIEACTQGGAGPFVKIYWTISGENTEGKRGETDEILQAFQREATEVFIEGIDIDGNTVRRRVNTPKDLKTSLDDLEPLLLPSEELVLRSEDEAFINPDAVDGSSVERKTLFDRYGGTSQVFCADLTNTATIDGEKQTPNETIWWRTLNGHREKDPYGILSNVWTDQEFRALLDEHNGSLGGLSTRFKYLALMILYSSVWFLLPSAAVYLFLGGVGSFKVSWTNIPKDAVDGIMSCLIKNRPYHLAMAIWTIFYAVLKALPIKPVLNRESPLITHLTTLASMDMISIARLVKLPIVSSLKLLSKPVAWWQRKKGDTKHAIFEGRIVQLMSRMDGFIVRTPEWMRSNIYAPVTEEIYCRFVFDKVWHGILGFFAVNSAASRNSSLWPHSSWIWASSIFFGLSHIRNWLPDKSILVLSGDGGDDDDDDGHNLWSNVEGALLQSTSSFLSAFFVLGPLYSKYGLTSSIAAHAAMNAMVPVFSLLTWLPRMALTQGMKIGMKFFISVMQEHVRLFVHDPNF